MHCTLPRQKQPQVYCSACATRGAMKPLRGMWPLPRVAPDIGPAPTPFAAVVLFALLANCCLMNSLKPGLAMLGLRMSEGRSGLIPMRSSSSSPSVPLLKMSPRLPLSRTNIPEGGVVPVRTALAALERPLRSPGVMPKFGVVPSIIMSSRSSSSRSVLRNMGGSISSFFKLPRLESGSQPASISCVHMSTMSTDLPKGEVPISLGDMPMPMRLPEPREPAGGHSGMCQLPALLLPAAAAAAPAFILACMKS
mmetsp:Transcript_5244/g.11488  ORF Transcript_5244/g.11488 Transcript_5244/m.11488 type:complete len:252 (-) Transcript_5244:1297-2052(-)